jgi:DNA-binding response OmpR family regulator
MDKDKPVQATRILIVEDEPNAREASRLYLSHCGHDVATAADAESAIREAERQEPDVLVCDWRLGAGGSGVDVARAIQNRYATPVIFVTAHPIDELIEATADLAVSRYLKKPVSLAILAEAIAKAA